MQPFACKDGAHWVGLRSCIQVRPNQVGSELVALVGPSGLRRPPLQDRLLQLDHLRFGFGECFPDFHEHAVSERDAVHAAQPIRKLLQLVASSHGSLPAVE